MRVGLGGLGSRGEEAAEEDFEDGPPVMADRPTTAREGGKDLGVGSFCDIDFLVSELLAMA